MEQQYKGIVKWFSETKGYGFIRVIPEGREIFCHFSGILGPKNQRKNLREGEKVRFDIGQDERGHYALNVEVV